VLGKMASPGSGVLDHIGKAQRAITTSRDHVEDDAWATATEQVRELIDRRDWLIGASSPGRHALADVLATLYRLGHDDYPQVLDDYAEATDKLAIGELDMILRRPDLDSMVEAVIILTALGDTLLAALRRLAQENRAARQLGGDRRLPGPSEGETTESSPTLEET
jgi:signal transduction histidine kinase